MRGKEKREMKKKIIYYIIIGIFAITECFLMYFSYVNKNKIAEILEIENINDISIKNIKISTQGQGSEAILYIKFKIATQKYEEYQLNYSDESSEKNIYEGEIKNKKIKDNNDYICYYEKIIDNKSQKQELSQIRNAKYYLIVNSVFLIFTILLAIVRLKKNDTAIEIK